MRIFIVIMCFAVTSCSIGQRPDLEIYTLKPEINVAPAANSCAAKLTLQVNDPNAAAGIDSRQIAVMEGGNRLNYYEGVRWSATAAEMFGSILVDSFDHAKIFANVNNESDSLVSDLGLITDIRDFEVDDKATGEVRIRLSAKLVNTKTRQILVTVALDKKTSPDGNTMVQIVDAFNKASVDAAAEIVQQINNSRKICQAN